MKILALLLLLPAFAGAQVTKMFVPAWTSMTADNANFTVLKPFCAVVTPEAGITNATKLVGYVSGATCTTPVSFMIYEDTDDTGSNHLLASITVSGCSGAVGQDSLSAFSLTAGTPYRVCVCGTNTPIAYGSVQRGQPTEDVVQSQLLQAFNTANLGEAAQSCTAVTAAPPTATGAITPDTTSPGRNKRRIPVLMVEQ